MKSGFLSPFICKDYNSPVSFSLLSSSDWRYFEVCMCVKEKTSRVFVFVLLFYGWEGITPTGGAVNDPLECDILPLPGSKMTTNVVEGYLEFL